MTREIEAVAGEFEYALASFGIRPGRDRLGDAREELGLVCYVDGVWRQALLPRLRYNQKLANCVPQFLGYGGTVLCQTVGIYDRHSNAVQAGVSGVRKTLGDFSAMTRLGYEPREPAAHLHIPADHHDPDAHGDRPAPRISESQIRYTERGSVTSLLHVRDCAPTPQGLFSDAGPQEDPSVRSFRMSKRLIGQTIVNLMKSATNTNDTLHIYVIDTIGIDTGCWRCCLHKLYL
jgi:hypothetical protein